MATKYKVRRAPKSVFSRIVPESVQAFVARRVLDSMGLFLLCLGGFVLLALASYNRMDETSNTATAVETPVQNWMGPQGAEIADRLLQTVGLGGSFFGFAFVFWGIFLFKRNPLSPLWLRFVSLCFATLAAAAAFARLSSHEWVPQPYLGGAGGLMILQKTADFLPSDYAFTMASSAWAVAAILLFSHAVGIGFREWRWVCALAWNLVAAVCFFVHDSVVAFSEWVRHYTQPEFVPQTKEKSLRRGPIIPPFSSADQSVVLSAEEEEDDDEEEEDVYEDEDSAEDEDDEEGLSAKSGRPIKVVKTGKSSSKGSGAGRQKKFSLFEDDTTQWELPSLDLLQEQEEDSAPMIDEKLLQMNAELLQNVLSDFNVKGEIVSIHPGPVVTLYELEPAPGTKTSRVIGLADDIARSMSAISVRAAVVPGRNVIGIELPNRKRQIVFLREMLSTREYEKHPARLPLVLGKDIGGQPVIADLARMPHLLVAGTTGSGKSVAINTMILSLLYKMPPERCRFIMIDPKMLELSVYDDIPHLLAPVVTEAGKAIVALKWLVREMEDRYRAMSKLGVRNIDGYNVRLSEARKKGEVLMRKVQTGFDPDTGKPVYEEQALDLTDLPYIVVIVDEFADLMLVAGKDVESAIQRLAQMARAAGIHLIMATQRPSVDVITGVIKANFPTRISFAVSSKIDSRTILNEGGAEQLLGQGDMLFMAPGGRITRVHGPYASDTDVENVVTFLKSQGEPNYLEDITDGVFEGEGGEDGQGQGENCDDLYDEAVALVSREQKASTSFIQRHLQIGYNRAARIIEEMERQGVVGKANHVGKREVLVGER